MKRGAAEGPDERYKQEERARARGGGAGVHKCNGDLAAAGRNEMK